MTRPMFDPINSRFIRDVVARVTLAVDAAVIDYRGRNIEAGKPDHGTFALPFGYQQLLEFCDDHDAALGAVGFMAWRTGVVFCPGGPTAVGNRAFWSVASMTTGSDDDGAWVLLRIKWSGKS